MKNNISILVFSGVLLITFLVQSGCTHAPDKLVFEQDKRIYVIDRESSTVSIFTPEGKFTQLIGSPGAGNAYEPTPLPPAIIHYLLLTKASISGLVWNDLNGNRYLDANEQGVQDVRVFIDSNGNTTYNPDEQSTLTDLNGFYTIPRVKTGINDLYIDTLTLPRGYGFTTAHPVTVDLAKNESAKDNDFGVQDQSGVIVGTIWDQTDNSPMQGVLVYLDQNNDSEHTIGEPHDTTNSSGNYFISNLPGGIYKFNIDDETIGDKYYQEPGAGTNPTDVALAPGGRLTINITYVHKATISGVVRDAKGNNWEYVRLFIDLNGNGVYDAGEPVAVTDEFGRYIFNDLPPGTYTVMLLMPSGYNMLVSPGSVTTAAGDQLTDANFLTQAQPVTIASFVWDDENGNGIREPAEDGLSGLTIFLDTNNNGSQDGGELSTVTDDTGAYAFYGLEHGDFYIRADDSSLLNEYIPTTQPNPIHKVLLPQETYDDATFGYQSKLAPVHTLQNPTRLSWGSDGKLYVSDYAIGSVFIYDDALNLQGELKRLARPLAVSTDAVGNIYVGNRGRKNVEVYDASGNLIRSIGEGSLVTPNDLAFDLDNNIYILDSAMDTVLVYNQGGTLISAIGDSLLFDYAVSIAINYRDDGSGTEVSELYVADQPNCAIHIFHLDGSYQRSIGGCGSLYTTNWDGKFAALTAVAIDPYDYIHGLDNSLNVVQVFDPQTGTFVRSYNAYPVENEFLLNLQTDISIHPVEGRVTISNVATKSVETVGTVPAP